MSRIFFVFLRELLHESEIISISFTLESQPYFTTAMSQREVTPVLIRVSGEVADWLSAHYWIYMKVCLWKTHSKSYRCCLCVSCISRVHSTATGPGAYNCWSGGTASSSQLPWRQWGVCSRLRHRTTHLPWSCTSCQKTLTVTQKENRAGQGLATSGPCCAN